MGWVLLSGYRKRPDKGSYKGCYKAFCFASRVVARVGSGEVLFTVLGGEAHVPRRNYEGFLATRQKRLGSGGL